MNDAFENLAREKQERIINSALAEFAQHGYKRASTNNIVKAAGIGKGMLFFYFKNKQELFCFLIDYVYAYFEQYYLRMTKLAGDDLIEKYRFLNQFKMEENNKNPEIFRFLSKLYIDEEDGAVIAEAREHYEKIMSKRDVAQQFIYSDINTSLFREDLAVENIIKYVKWTMDGYIADIMARIKRADLSEFDYEPYLTEYEQYLNDLKTLYYKK